jgi:hypothetical protein
MKKGSETWLAIGLITLVTVLTYGVLIPQLGFYRDDWYLFSTAQSQGSAGIVALFQIDRPLVGYLYAIGFKLLGLSPLAWQVVTLFIRLAGNLALFWLLRLLWPEWRMETLAVTLLFSVYPGYTVQPNAGVYISDLLASASALVSIALTIKALQSTAHKESARPWFYFVLSALAGLLAVFYLGIFEAAIGLEAARFALVWYVIWRRDHPGFRISILRTLRADLFYIFIGGAFLVWRLFFFQSTRRATNLGVLLGRYGALPVHSLISVTVETLKDILETTVFAWVVPFYQFTASSNYRDLVIATGMALVVVVCIAMVFRVVYKKPVLHDTAPGSNSAVHLIWLGLFIVVMALVPIDAAGRNVLFSDQWDRYTIYASLGVAMVVGGLIFHFFQGPTRKGLLLALIGMSVVVHFFSAAFYRDFWGWQRDLWQQMIWRAPSLRPGTMLFAMLPFAGYEEGYEIYGPANMVYYPGQGIQVGGDVLNSDTAANLQLQKNREHYDRSVLIPDNYKNALIAVYPSLQSCLHVLDGRKVELPGLLDNSLVADAAPYSQINQVDASAPPATLPGFLSGEHPRAWCFYYQKMDLARQQGEWEQVASLADEALKKGQTPEDVSEWMPALEAYVTLGRDQDARHAASIIRANDKARSFLCLQLQRGTAYPAPYKFNQVNQLLCQAN